MRATERIRRTWSAAAAGLLLILGVTSARASLLGNLLPLPRQKVIIQTQGTPTGELLNLVRLLGGKIYASFETIDGFAADLPLPVLSSLLARLDIVRVTPDLPVVGSADLTNSAIGATAARADTGLDGLGVGVAVLDTGVAPHPDLMLPLPRIVGWKDLVNGRLLPYDDSGHGTHVAGIIAGNGWSAGLAGQNLRGVAPRAHIVGVKVLDSQMRGYASTAIKGLDWCLANRKIFNIRVVNLSLGQPVQGSCEQDPLCQAVEKLWKKGIVVVVSAGNLGRTNPADPNSGTRYGTITSPGNDPLVLTVGATRTNWTHSPGDDEVATYSSRGPTVIDRVIKPDVVAPGNRVLSLGTNGRLAASFPNDVTTLGGARYQRLSGTSMAAPVVAGAVALMIQQEPRITPDTVKIRLMHTATKGWSSMAAGYRPFDRGAGLIDLPRALRSRETAAWAARSPELRRSSGAGVYLPSGAGALSSDVYGAGSVWFEDEAAEETYAQEPPPPAGSYPPPSPPWDYWGGYQPPPPYPSISTPPPGGYPGGSYGGYPSGYPGGYPGGSYPGGSYPGGNPGYVPPDDAQILWGEPSLYADAAFWDDEDDRTDCTQGTMVADP